MSMTIQFDTLQYVEKLKSSGIPEAQAKAASEALSTALGESASGTLATKADVTNIKAEMTDLKSELKLEMTDLKSELKLEMAEVKSELKLLKWMVVTIVAGVISLVAKTFW